ncbi:MAG: XRE family transcriptional regulator [Halobacteriovoraceae bacterium]|nr:XRE family transcriptional regulator [Halobacteriovoraceae bacterium]
MSKFPDEKTLEKIRKKFETAPASQALPKKATVAERMKYDLCQNFVIYLQESGITQRELAQKLGVSETVVSRILHYHIEDFTIDRLVNYTGILFSDAKIRFDIAV